MNSPPHDPHYSHQSAHPGQRYALCEERVGATLIDAAILIGFAAAAGVVTGIFESLAPLAGLLWLGLAGYLAWLNGSTGQSPGKALKGLKVVRGTDGAPLGGPTGLLRGLSLSLMLVLTFGVLFLAAVLWPLRDAAKQALHDKVVGAYVTAGHPRAPFGTGIFLPR